MKINKNYKSSVFTELFGTDEKIIELYCAIDGKPYPENAEIKINTLQDALFMDRLNDVSFTIDDKLIVLVEHQSMINENMPLRALYYISRLYEKIVESRNIYRKKLVKIPTPEFFVLYNGVEEYPDKCILKLSDAYKVANNDIELELIVKVFNINKGHNAEIVQRSKTLDDYISFVDMIRAKLNSGKALESAIKEAMSFCIENGILRDFLETNGAEVANMLYVEWNWDDALEVAREEGVEEGIEIGAAKSKKEQTLEIAKKMIKRNRPIGEIIEDTGLTEEEVKSLLPPQ